ncbi:L,D-transpeptidase [Amycolatopsis sp. FDAARGOS 1241]|uniref:L,D-transpeptidase n=1 Tax=Amycolatopsis sp. FDAARGOS 1241 TaxID=2778070 RepID=UPI001EF3CE21|nr:L,D-transpeptidase [Amycolatopsis sp. FDAARGOS 1241]
MKRLLVSRLSVAAVAASGAFLLAACSGGSPAPGSVTGGGAVAAGAEVPATATSSSAPATTAAAPTTTSSPATSTSTPKPTSTKPTTTSKPKAKTTSATVPCAKAVAASGTAACVDISAHKAWLLRDGKVIYGPVSMLPGRKGNPTPTGTFSVTSKEKMHYSHEFDNAEMPNSVFFYPGDAFHTGSLKTYSHGCVHLSATSSLKFFNTLHVGDVVQVVP